jgi:N-acetylmuramoyl-L-alanine amidase
MALASLAMVAALIAQSGADLPQEEVGCLARNIYHEARGESLEGQIAVAHVTLNRVGEFAGSVCGVVYQRSQFSWTIGGEKAIRDERAFQIATTVAINAMTGRDGGDPTHGAAYYYAFHQVTPSWAAHMNVTAEVGNHLFLRDS